eukprot:GHVQ01012763.1.p1 GENE.GHVQ01012763.1~~GHVQ01012763.1.p1  ORF type:complete len:219 (+),score=27.44 GHVQ01012763.1:108-764(+)
MFVVAKMTKIELSRCFFSRRCLFVLSVFYVVIVGNDLCMNARGDYAGGVGGGGSRVGGMMEGGPVVDTSPDRQYEPCSTSIQPTTTPTTFTANITHNSLVSSPTSPISPTTSPPRLLMSHHTTRRLENLFTKRFPWVKKYYVAWIMVLVGALGYGLVSMKNGTIYWNIFPTDEDDLRYIKDLKEGVHTCPASNQYIPFVLSFGIGLVVLYAQYFYPKE